MGKTSNRSAGKISVIIPTYNEKKTIKHIVENVLKHVKHVVVVDDCSTDSTINELSDFEITLLQNNENLGKAGTLWRGIDHAIRQGFEKIITMDADGQHMPDDIPRFIETSYDYPRRIVVGMRFQSSVGIPKARYNANKFANFWVAWASGMPLKDSQCGFRLYPAELFSQVKIKTKKGRGFVFESEVLIEAGRNGYKVVSIPIDAIYSDDARASHFRPVLDIAKITIMVAGKLLSRGLYLKGLYRSLIGKVE
jgi:glycosyltransferase involved in cell wall biosynthesis